MEGIIIVAIVGLIQGVSVAIINGIMVRNRKADEEREEKRKKERKERELMRFERDKTKYELLFAMADAIEVLIKKTQRDKHDEDVEDAMAAIHSAKVCLNSICNAEIARL